MSVSTAIGMVSKSLQDLLSDNMKFKVEDNIAKPDVTILAPDEEGKAHRVNLFLYKVQENPILKNMDWQVKPDSGTANSPGKSVPPPLSLNLFYLMTVYTESDEVTGNINAHKILGEAMRVFYEYPIVPKKYLQEGLKDSKEQVRIMLNTLDLEELSKVWATFIKAFRLSVLYEVSVVQLDMLSERERDITKVVDETAIQVSSSYKLPRLERIEPIKGPAGSFVYVHGKNLSGQHAYATLMGENLPVPRELKADSFRLTIPPQLTPGIYQIQVDISHLCRQTFIFKVEAGGIE